MIENVIDIEGASLLPTALSATTPATLFTDFGTAFPSLFVQWVCHVLFAIGAPSWLINYVYYIYSNGDAFIGVGGQRFSTLRFELCRGLGQGCTGAALLFGIALDPVLRWMSFKLGPETCTRAYVDDLALVLRDL